MGKYRIRFLRITARMGLGHHVKGISPGRCSVTQQRGAGRHPVTARVKWKKEVNKVVMECFYRSKPFDEEEKLVRGYKKRILKEWRERGMFESTKQRARARACVCVCDQA